MSRNPSVTQDPGTVQLKLVACKQDVSADSLVAHDKGSPKIARRQKVMNSMFIPKGLIYREVRSVRDRTIRDYQQRMDKFNHWLRLTTAQVTNHDELDSTW